MNPKNLIVHSTVPNSLERRYDWLWG